MWICCINTCYIFVFEEETSSSVGLEKSVVCKPSEQHTMTSYTPTDTRQKELDDALVNYIAGDLLALSTVDRYPGQILTERPYIRDPYVHTNGLNIMFLLKLTICESI